MFVHLVNLRFLKLSLHGAKRLWPEDLSSDGYRLLLSSLLLCVFSVSGEGCCVLTGRRMLSRTELDSMSKVFVDEEFHVGWKDHRNGN